MPSVRNKTIRITSEDIQKYSKNLITLESSSKNISHLVDKIINQDIFEALKFFPLQSIDLLIIDPPYNLNKKFGVIQFKKQEIEAYNEYIDKWISLILPLLKKLHPSMPVAIGKRHYHYFQYYLNIFIFKIESLGKEKKGEEQKKLQK